MFLPERDVPSRTGCSVPNGTFLPNGMFPSEWDVPFRMGCSVPNGPFGTGLAQASAWQAPGADAHHWADDLELAAHHGTATRSGLAEQTVANFCARVSLDDHPRGLSADVADQRQDDLADGVRPL